MKQRTSPSPTRELAWVALALASGWVVWAAAARLRHVEQPVALELAPWQQPFQSLPLAEQRRAVSVREAILELENLRSDEGHWPTPDGAADAGVEVFSAPGWRWASLREGLVTTYVGQPSDEAALRWLVLFIEPVPAAGRAALPPPIDDEHHTLFDGTALHVTLWAQPNQGPGPEKALSFPASAGWTQQVTQGPRASR